VSARTTNVRSKF